MLCVDVVYVDVVLWCLWMIFCVCVLVLLCLMVLLLMFCIRRLSVLLLSLRNCIEVNWVSGC